MEPSTPTNIPSIPTCPPPEAIVEEVPNAKKRSKAWGHFTEYKKDGLVRAQCNHCIKSYACDGNKNGTTNLNKHMNECKNNPNNVTNNRVRSHTMHNYVHGVTGVEGQDDIREMSSLWKFDQHAVRKAVVIFLIVDEHPFRTVEKEGFRGMMAIACPKFIVPSRRTVARDCFNLYLEEKTKLKDYFKKHVGRVSLTTDTWTASNQKINYMCLTAHFIDDNWKLHKRLINFVPCPSHKGEEVGRLLERCLLDWGISNIFTITVDNASSNDTSVAWLRRRMVGNKTDLLGGKFLQMRCVAHIVNLVVRDGLKDANTSIDRVRNAVRWVRQSTARISKFETYQVEEGVESKKSLCLDVPTRWNSVYLMLQTALIFQKVFEKFEMCDSDLRADFRVNGPYGAVGYPTRIDWIVVENMVKILKHFYDLTLRISGSLYVTSNTFLDEISDVDDEIKKWKNSNDLELKEMATKMKLKFDKYWGDNEKMNMLLYVAVMLDPRNKFDYVLHVMENMHGETQGLKIANLAKDALTELFKAYKSTMQPSSSSSSNISTSTDGSQISESEQERANKRVVRRQYQKMISNRGLNEKNELERFLGEQIIEESIEFDLLMWWKMHTPIYPVLAVLAQHIFAMPISTVASESAFSTGGRIIDDYRSSLTPKTAQALICGQDWLRQAPIGFLEESSEAEAISNIYQDVVARATFEMDVLRV